MSKCKSHGNAVMGERTYQPLFVFIEISGLVAYDKSPLESKKRKGVQERNSGQDWKRTHRCRRASNSPQLEIEGMSGAGILDGSEAAPGGRGLFRSRA